MDLDVEGLPETELDAMVARMEEIQQEIARIIATPAEGTLGIAIKLRVAADNP